MKKTARQLHTKKKRLETETYTLKAISKQYQLFGNTKGQVINSKGKQEIKEAQINVMKTVESMLELVKQIDESSAITDKALAKLYEYHKTEQQRKVFRTSPLWP
jgi:hypothetical protein